MADPLKLIFAGSGEFAIPTLQALADSDRHQIVLVVSQPDRPAGRGRRLTPTPVSRLAIERNLPLLRTEDINREPLPPADLLIVIAFGQKIAPHQVQHPRLGAINLHGSLLPRFRGAAPVNAAILAGEKITGNSVIRLVQRMDAGPILAQSQLAIGELETAGELHDRLAADGARLVVDTIDKLATGQVCERPQDESQASRAPRLSRASARIDWTSPAEQIARQIRGLYPWPGCHVRLEDESPERRQIARLTLVRARPVEGSGPPGLILPSGAVAAGTGAVEILEVQPEGKRPMPLSAFRNGHPWHAGMRLES
ncbi:MAG TPA: methionyl-tRNA formyltransferase [Tepidisphaeraceae bacterium]|nr:methionyl-tRNA formyltransferase [Tepidisphaeraceae bacterium]